MANELDEMTGPVNKEGRDVNVIEKQIKVEMTTGLKALNVLVWVQALFSYLFHLSCGYIRKQKRKNTSKSYNKRSNTMLLKLTTSQSKE